MNSVRSAGDFNPRGVAKDYSAKPARGSLQERLSKWFVTALADPELATSDSDATHRAEGALEVHISAVPSPDKALLTWKAWSDHAITHKPCALHGTFTHKQQAWPHVQEPWARDATRWSQALAQWRDIFEPATKLL